MCGIAGSVALTDRGRRFDVAKAIESIGHRGPDERGQFVCERVQYGNCRLSIIDLAGGSQPVFNDDRTRSIVFNGELYNFRELRHELEQKGARFISNCDTEVVLRAFEQWGDDCLKRFNGMFALAIWDSARNRLLLARDPIGEKPLYYYCDGDRLIFGSEIKAILTDPDVPRRVSPLGLVNYLSYGHSVAPQTMFDGIVKLLPGHKLVVEKGQVTTSEFWDVGRTFLNGMRAKQTSADVAVQLRELLDDSVRMRMVADVPVGAFLSGGVDSSLVVSLMTRHASERVKTFSVGFNVGGNEYNELSAAAEVARWHGTDHRELTITHLDLIQVVQALVRQYDEPFADGANLPLYLLSRFAREHVKVVLTGEGGDELFAGYRRYAADGFAPAYQRLPGMAKGLVSRAVSAVPRFRRVKTAVQALSIEDPGRRASAWLETFPWGALSRVLSPEWRNAIADYDPVRNFTHYYGHHQFEPGADDHLNRLLYVDFKTWLPDAFMEKVDKATMACGLEARAPILDPRIVEFAFQLPGSMKLRGWSTKVILKQACEGLVPPAVLKRPKHGFAVPTDLWFRGEMTKWVEDILFDPRTRARPYFNARSVEEIYMQHRSGAHVLDRQIWALLNFELWHREYIDTYA
jgi:asparagine synthase (glutamine-hydrolysing)